jgi:hypothetical protein
MNETMWSPRRYTEPSHDYLERQFHRVVVERDNYRGWSWFWFILALAGWSALITLALHESGILGT